MTRLRWSGVILAVLVWWVPAWAGTYSFSFPPGYCAVAGGAPVLTTTGGGLTKPAWAFPITSDGSNAIWCQVQFPYQALDALVDVNLTWQSGTTTGQACWTASYAVSRDGVPWGNVTGSEGTAITTTEALGTYTANTDLTTAVNDVPAYDVKATSTCDPVNCKGHHGVLRIRRASTGTCPSQINDTLLLTHINFTMATP